jgi:hypothetical protein
VSSETWLLIIGIWTIYTTAAPGYHSILDRLQENCSVVAGKERRRLALASPN